MKRFESDKYYRPADTEMRLIATEGTLAIWRHEGRGPTYRKIGRRIWYLGQELNMFIDEQRVEPTAA